MILFLLFDGNIIKDLSDPMQVHMKSLFTSAVTKRPSYPALLIVQA